MEMTTNLLIAMVLLTILHSSSSNNSTTVLLDAQIDPKIIGGSAIKIDKAPWQVSIRLRAYETELFGLGHICGGSVITQRVVLTAAHCALILDVKPVVKRSTKDFIVVMGSGYLFQRTENTLQFNVLQLIVHDNFSLDTMLNDVALMFLNGTIPLTHPTIRPTPLNVFPLPVGSMCTTTGWGKMRNNEISNDLMAVSVPIIDYNLCKKSYGAISKAMLCAGYMSGEADACQGDSGGPLHCGDVLAGIVSWGFDCGQEGFPGVYTNVSNYRSWIINKNATFNYTGFASGAIAVEDQWIFIVISCFVFIFFSIEKNKIN